MLNVFKPARPDESYPLVFTKGQKGVKSVGFLKSYVGWQGCRAPIFKRRKEEKLGNNRLVSLDYISGKKSGTNNSAIYKQLDLTRK